MAVAGDVTVHLKQGSSTQREGRCGTGGGPKQCAGLGLQGLRWPLIWKHSVDIEVIDGAGSRISG